MAGTDRRVRAIDWVAARVSRPGHIRLLDQTLLPDRAVFLDIDDPDVLVDAIKRLAVRGAPALGVAGAMGVALATQNLPDAAALDAAGRLREARPTAVNLARGVDAALAAHAVGGASAALQRALRIRDQDIESCAAMAGRGADLLDRLLLGAGPVTIMTICNTGALAAVEHGTALGVIEKMHVRGRLAGAVVCETRPLLQGSRLTAWELQQMGAPYDVIVDSAAAAILAAGGADAVVVGADRIAANGDTANKIGTFALALAARYARVPFLVVAPDTTVDLDTPSGSAIHIEDRGSDEVCAVRGVRTAPQGSTARNPAFDVTPAALVTAIVTDSAVIDLAAGQTPAHRGA